MEVKLILSNSEYKELVSYCNLNDLLISSVVKDSFTTGFNIERYGLLNSTNETPKEIIKEVIVEKKVEVPVEVIKEIIKIEYVEVEKPVEKVVEITKEVPVEVIKEVVIEKQVDGDLQPKLDALQNTLQKIRLDNIEKDNKIKEYEKTIQEIQKFQSETKAMFLKGSNLEDNLYK